MSWKDQLNQAKSWAAQQQNQFMQNWKPQTGSYLESSGASNLAQQGKWNDYMRQLGLSYLFNITDMSSPLYQQFAQFQRNTMPGVGVNTLLAPLIASGVDFGTAQGIAQQRTQEFMRERNDTIGNSVRNFAMGMQNNVLPTIGQIGQSFFTQQELAQRDKQVDQANSPFGALAGVLGQLFGMFASGGFGGAGSAGAAAATPMVLKR